MELKNKAIASLVLGVLAVISVFTGIGAIVGLILGIVGIILSVNVRKQLQMQSEVVNDDPAMKDMRGMATAGLVCSIVGTAIAGIGFICIACIAGTIGVAACNMAPL